MTPNAFAPIALALWPFIALAVFATSRSRWSAARTSAWMLVLPLMFLPAHLSLKLAPGIPELDKHRLSCLAVFLGLALFHTRRPGETLKAHWFPRFILLVMLWGVVQTVATNPDPLVFGPTKLPGLTTHDTLSISIKLLLDIYLPFAIGERVFRTERDLRDLFQVLALSAVIYFPLGLVELVLSPQLHRWLYGYHQHDFGQHVRMGGFRPMIFMSHGLSVSMYVFTALMASLALDRVHEPARLSPRTCVGVSAVFLLLCKSLASLIYGTLGVLMHFFLLEKAKARIVLAIAVFVLVYPIIRVEDLLPRARIVQFFENYSKDRAESLLFRFNQEEQLLARARERPVYGWGSWGRNQIYAEWGDVLSITDGQWIIMLGTFGLVGFSAFFVLLTVPLFRFVRRRKRMPLTSQWLVGTLAVTLAFCLLDLLPNSLSDCLPLVYAGALYSLSGRLRRTKRPAEPEPERKTQAVLVPATVSSP